MAVLVRQQEIRHELAGYWCGLPDATRVEPRDHPVNGIGKAGADVSHIIGEGLQSLR